MQKILAILTLVGTLAVQAAAVLQVVKPNVAATVAAIGTAILAFTRSLGPAPKE